MPDQEPPLPKQNRWLLKPRHSGRVQAICAENDALRAERQLLLATIDQLKQENDKLKNQLEHTELKIMASMGRVIEEHDRYEKAIAGALSFLRRGQLSANGKGPGLVFGLQDGVNALIVMLDSALHP